MFSKNLTNSPKIIFEVKRGFKLGNINFLDATKGTGFFKWENEAWGYRGDRDNYVEDAENPKPRPHWMDKKYNSFETYFDTKFKNGDSFKVKTGSNKVLELNVALKNLRLPECDSCCKNQTKLFFNLNKKTINLKFIYSIKGISNETRKRFVDEKELTINLKKEIRTNYLKQLSFEYKGKETNENLKLTIKGSSKDEKVKRDYELVYNCPFNDNFKVKVVPFFLYLDHF